MIDSAKTDKIISISPNKSVYLIKDWNIFPKYATL